MGPKKYLGQHFLTAPAFAKRIAEAVPCGAAPSSADGTVNAADAANAVSNVLEIGPGRGALSVHLAERFPSMHLVEVDKDAVSVLKEKLAGIGGGGKKNVTIHNENVMTFDFAKAGFPLHVVGNLPYNIGAMIIKKTLMYAPNVLSCTFMVQKEVAARIVSEPHSRQNGFLSIFCQFFGEAKILFHVPPGAFFPRPNVDSSVFQIIVDINAEKKLDRGQWENFFSFVDAGFSMRRKQLAKTMSWKLGGEKGMYGNILKDMGMNESIRPEDLGVSGWLDFYKRVKTQ